MMPMIAAAVASNGGIGRSSGDGKGTSVMVAMKPMHLTVPLSLAGVNMSHTSTDVYTREYKHTQTLNCKASICPKP